MSFSQVHIETAIWFGPSCLLGLHVGLLLNFFHRYTGRKRVLHMAPIACCALAFLGICISDLTNPGILLFFPPDYLLPRMIATFSLSFWAMSGLDRWARRRRAQRAALKNQMGQEMTR